MDSIYNRHRKVEAFLILSARTVHFFFCLFIYLFIYLFMYLFYVFILP